MEIAETTVLIDIAHNRLLLEKQEGFLKGWREFACRKAEVGENYLANSPHLGVICKAQTINPPLPKSDLDDHVIIREWGTWLVRDTWGFTTVVDGWQPELEDGELFEEEGCTYDMSLANSLEKYFHIEEGQVLEIKI